MRKKRLQIDFPIGRFSAPLFCENGDIWLNHQDALYRITDGARQAVLEYGPWLPGKPAARCAVESPVCGVLAPAALHDHIYLLAGSGQDGKELLYRFDRAGNPTVLAEFPWAYHALLSSRTMLYLLGEQRVTLADQDGAVVLHWEQSAAEMKNAMVGLERSIVFLGQGPYCGMAEGCCKAKYPIVQAGDDGSLHTVYTPAREEPPPLQTEYDVLVHGLQVFFARSQRKKHRTEMQIRCFAADPAGQLAQTSCLRFRQNRRLSNAYWGRVSVSSRGFLFTDTVVPPQFYSPRAENCTLQFWTEVYYAVHRLWLCPFAAPDRPQVIALPVNALTRNCIVALPPLQTSDGTVFLTGSTLGGANTQFLARWRDGVWSFRKFPHFEAWYLHHDTIYATHCWNKGALYEIPQELGYRSE